ncbi:MAG: HAD-IIIA family hydrolase [Bacteroidales bacterium]|nr:HAD-IIIA family hydrolase [Bacteroidales bacterium]MBN2757205.1 HAD-IIIA family hydrolase [Bacteroidales bacterium]
MPKKNKAIFLDRDGVINNNSNTYYTFKKEDFILNDGVIKSLKIFYDKGFILIIISNQGGISKKAFSITDVENLQTHINEIFEKENIKITDSYFCPHHSDIEKCICRKPDSLLLEKAVARYKIDIEKSFFIGDSERDIMAGEKAGIKSIKINANKNLFDEIVKAGYSYILE